MKRIPIWTFWIAVSILALSACAPGSATVQPESPAATPKPAKDMATAQVASQVGIANPASVYCEQQGGRVEIRTDSQGGQYGVCIFPDGSECDEWAFFRGECQPGSPEKVLPPAPAEAQQPVETIPTQAPVAAQPKEPAGGRISKEPPPDLDLYVNPSHGYRLQLPAGCVIESDDPAQGVQITGPLVDNEHWPVMFINHRDSEAFHLPAGVNLVEWLRTHEMLNGEQQLSVVIAGETAVHLRTPGSPQAYAVDLYYFVKAGQLYQVGILQTGNEDWQVYNRFLAGIAFPKH